MSTEIKDITATNTAPLDDDWLPGQRAAGGSGSTFKLSLETLRSFLANTEYLDWQWVYDEYYTHVLSGVVPQTYPIDATTITTLLSVGGFSGGLVPTLATGTFTLAKDGWQVRSQQSTVATNEMMNIRGRLSVAGSSTSVRATMLSITPSLTAGDYVAISNVGMNATTGALAGNAGFWLREDKKWVLSMGICPLLAGASAEVQMNAGLMAGNTATVTVAGTTARAGWHIFMNSSADTFTITPRISDGGTVITDFATIVDDCSNQAANPYIFDLELSCDGAGNVTSRYRKRNNTTIDAWTILDTEDISALDTSALQVGLHYGVIYTTPPATGANQNGSLSVDYFYFAQER